ncbi:hypothetical protein Xenpb_01199 [Xenorhabdus sp. PB62.4]|nr:hypothetical protein [Xenorhabdus sp. PB62.4]
MSSLIVSHLKELPSSTAALILLAVVLCTLTKHKRFSPLTSRQSFFLLMTFLGVIGLKVLFS